MSVPPWLLGNCDDPFNYKVCNRAVQDIPVIITITPPYEAPFPFWFSLISPLVTGWQQRQRKRFQKWVTKLSQIEPTVDFENFKEIKLKNYLLA